MADIEVRSGEGVVTLTVVIRLSEVVADERNPPPVTDRLTDSYAAVLRDEARSWFDWGVEGELLDRALDAMPE